MKFAGDGAARRWAVREFERPLVIEAGAGTGKTRTLVARVGTWLLGAGWEEAAAELAVELAAEGAAATASAIAARACERVVAITFTDAAAAEMAGRIDDLLSQAAAGGPMEDLESAPEELAAGELGRRGAALLAASSRLRVSTIHGFCHRLLAESPFEAGLHPGFAVDADDGRTAELATAVLLARLRAEDPDLVALLAAGVDPPELLEALVALVGAGVAPDELRVDPFDDAALAPRFAALDAACARVLAIAAPLRQGRKVAGILRGLDALEELRTALRGQPPNAAGLLALALPFETAAEAAKKVFAGWAKGEFGKTEREALGDATLELAGAAEEAAARHLALVELDPELLRLARRALAAPLAELAARRRAAGVVSFGDLLERAARLLGERAGVRARVRRGIRQLLVDEFQDTDRRQCDLLRALVLADADAPPPELFLVGDPKQSIYGWRSADLRAYASFLDELAAAGARCARLEVNFRSVPAILDEVERALAPVLVEDPGRQAGFQALRAAPHRAEAPGFVTAGRAPVEYWASWDRDALVAGDVTAASRSAEIEAAAIARDTRELVERGAAKWGDFALLLRARGDLDLYLDAFRRAGVPYEVQKDRSYYRRREVVDAAAGVRAILDPSDLLAAVAFLRSPFVGVPDAAWIPLWRSGFPAAWMALDGERGLADTVAAIEAAAADLPLGLPESARAPGWNDSLVAAVEAVAALREEFRRLPAAAWVERLRARLLLEPIAAAGFLGRFGLANLERLFSELELRLASEPDAARALAELRRAVAEETPAEEARPPEAQPDAVSVMTVHTAKGLQFQHVYLAQAQRRPGGPGADALPAFAFGPPAARREMTLFGSPTPGWRDVQAERGRVAAAEAARLLYVATTRAAERLVICGRWPLEGGRAPRGGAAPSFADLLAGRLAGAPLPTLDAPLRHDEHGALWRLVDAGPQPASAAPPAAAAAPRGALAPPPEELVARRAAAGRRSLRPRFAPASALGAGTADRGSENERSAPLTGESIRGRTLARVRGVALHLALELRALADTDLDAWRDRVGSAVIAELPDADAAEVEAIVAAADDLRPSHLWSQLTLLESRQSVLARELPLLMRADSDDQGAPTDGYVGTLDLLYRDAECGDLVVADFKSDAVPDADTAEELAARYTPQLALYGRAVRDALELDAPPRLELWLLAADRILVLSGGDGRGSESG